MCDMGNILLRSQRIKTHSHGASYACLCVLYMCVLSILSKLHIYNDFYNLPYCTMRDIAVLCSRTLIPQRN